MIINAFKLFDVLGVGTTVSLCDYKDLVSEPVQIDLVEGASLYTTASESPCIDFKGRPYPSHTLSLDGIRVVVNNYKADDAPGRPTGAPFCIGVLAAVESKSMG